MHFMYIYLEQTHQHTDTDKQTSHGAHPRLAIDPSLEFNNIYFSFMYFNMQ